MSNERQAREKREFRAKMKTVRKENKTPERDALLAQNFLILPEIRDKKIFFIYRSFGSEADTMPVINALLHAGKTVLFPRVEGENMVAAEYRGQPTRTSPYGIEEPTGEEYKNKEDIDVTILPLLAADKNGNRLGYGGGYYDKFLKDISCLKIGYCYDFQISDEPFSFAEEHDVRLDLIVTDKRVIRTERN